MPRLLSILAQPLCAERSRRQRLPATLRRATHHSAPTWRQLLPAGATHDEDDDCAICGDGVVGAGETCDPPERCLTERSCVAPDPCVLATLRGAPSSCDTRCELTPMTTCQSGDGCCPTQCAQDRDGDCSATCGDGEVDPRSETCDLSSETQPCSEVDCDDGEACTLDLPTGSAQNCNVSCTHTTITDPADDDGCCPRGATAQSDTDCTPSCGNGRLEPGEDCDGEPDCSERCTLPGPLRCRDELARYDGISDDCIACTCARCEARVAGCHDRTDPADGVACSAVLSCAREHECDAAACYCGLDRGCAPVDGPCREELEDAAGSRIPAQVLGCLNNASCPAARAFALQTCMQFNCAEVCAP